MNDYQHLFDSARARLKPCACPSRGPLMFVGTVVGDPHVECGACMAKGPTSSTPGLKLFDALEECVVGWNER